MKRILSPKTLVYSDTLSRKADFFSFDFSDLGHNGFMKARETEKKGKTMLKSKTQIVGSYEIRKFASRDYRIVDSQGQVIGSFTNKSHAKAFAVRNQQEHN